MPRPRAWADTVFNQPLTDAQQVNSDLLVDLPASPVITVVRIIGRLTICPNSITNQISGLTVVDFAIGVSSVEAFTASVLPDADQSVEAPPRGWLWTTRTICIQDRLNTEPASRFVDQIEFDVRSMRKVDKGRLFLQMENNQASGTAFTVSVIGRVRVLCVT